MANTIKVKQSSVQGKTPTTAQLELGELAINTYDGKLFLKKNVAGTESIIDVTAASSGTVTSVAATVPTGFTISGSPVTTSGTLAIAFDTGYALPTSAKQTNWDTAYGWGNHASAGYLTSAVTSVGATAPVASSGGNTPTISLADGYGDTKNPFASKTQKYVLAAPNNADGVPSFRALVASDIPTLNQNTTGSAASLSISGQTGLLTFTGLAANSRAKTVRDAADTVLELGGSYTPTGTWVWTSATVTWPTFNQDTTGSAVYWKTAGTGKAALSGPAVGATRTYTFPDANATVLTTNAAVTAAQGGTGQDSSAWTGLVKTAAGTWSTASAGTDYASPSQTFYIGTTQVAINRASANLALTGITSIDGSAASATSATKCTNLVGGNGTTLLGSVPYQSGTDTTTLLAPNTSATKNFLSQTGTGTNGAAPSWSTVTKSDVGLSAVENTALSTWGGSSNITTVGTIGTGTWSGTTIAVNKGGTGATTLTGILVGNGTSAFSAAVSGTDIKTVNGSSLLGSGDLATLVFTGFDGGTASTSTFDMTLDLGGA